MKLYINDPTTNPDLHELRFVDHLHSAPFLIESHQFELVTDITDCDFISILCDPSVYQQQVDKILEYSNIKNVIHLDIFHIYEGISTTPYLDRMKLLLE